EVQQRTELRCKTADLDAVPLPPTQSNQESDAGAIAIVHVEGVDRQLFRLLVLEHLEGGPPDCARRLRIKSSLEDKGQTSSILPDFQRSSCGRHTREISKE